ncbi:GapS6a family protein [Kangiella shandongensis]|uniref:GapS6a family protein n=1 Tax=Kangiella shandongensis TaxID=2763258 RepID=UPI001CC0248B|nr:hypothetical protein [Kangiella shandongensis]
MIEYLTSTILSGMTYDFLKDGAKSVSSKLKEALKEWAFDEDERKRIAEEVASLNLSSEMSFSDVKSAINGNRKINTLLEQSRNKIIQTHNGEGNNIGMIINNKN